MPLANIGHIEGTFGHLQARSTGPRRPSSLHRPALLGFLWQEKERNSKQDWGLVLASALLNVLFPPVSQVFLGGRAVLYAERLATIPT